MDLLNLAPAIRGHYRSLGGWTFEFADYVAVGCVGPVVDSPQFAKMAAASR